MGLDRQKIQDASKTFRAVFMEALRTKPGLWQQLVNEEKITGKESQQNWLGPAGAVREWSGDDRPAEKFRAYAYTLAGKKWANTVLVDVEDLEDDNLGLYRPRIAQAARNFDLHRTKLLFQQLMADGFAGTRGLAYDGQYFFDSDHLDDEEGVQTNTATAAFSTAALDAAIAAGMQLKDSKGDYIDVNYTHLFAPPQLRATVKKVVGNAHILVDSDANDASVALENYNQGVVTPIIVPWLAGSATAWFLADLSKELKPFRYLNRVEPQWQALDRPDSDKVFETDKVRYGGRARYNMGYGWWQLIRGSTGAG